MEYKRILAVGDIHGMYFLSAVEKHLDMEDAFKEPPSSLPVLK